MTFFRRPDNPKRTNSLPSVSRFRALMGTKRGREGIGSEELGNAAASYSDATTAQHLIGRQPVALHRSRTFVLAWRASQPVAASSATTTAGKHHADNASLSLSPIQKAASLRLALPGHLYSVAPVFSPPPTLHNQPSMSFPHHLRTKSQPATSVQLPNSLQFPLMDASARYTQQPWWHSGFNGVTKAKTNTEEGNIKVERTSDKRVQPAPSIQAIHSLDAVVHRLSISSLSTVAKVDPAVEEPASSDTSFNTCPTPPLDLDVSDCESSPRMCMAQGSTLDLFGKDPCQSPLPNLFTCPVPFQAEKEVDDGSFRADQSQSIEDWGAEPNGLEIDDIEKSIQDYVSSEEPGRQERLHGWTSVGQLRSVNHPLSPSSVALEPRLKHKLSLSDFLDELHKQDDDEDDGLDDSFGSGGSFDEEDSVEICRAWRNNAALSGLGASLANAHLQSDSGRKSSNLLPRQSRVSLRGVELDTIQEASFDSWQDSLDDDSFGQFDLCAHLLKRARQGPMTSAPRKTI